MIQWFDLPDGGVLEFPPVGDVALELHLVEHGGRVWAVWLTDGGELVGLARGGNA